MFEKITDALRNELLDMEDKYHTGAQMNEADLKHIDTMAHALKCIATYSAMEDYGGSSRRRRYTGYPSEPENYDRRY